MMLACVLTLLDCSLSSFSLLMLSFQLQLVTWWHDITIAPWILTRQWILVANIFITPLKSDHCIDFHVRLVFQPSHCCKLEMARCLYLSGWVCYAVFSNWYVLIWCYWFCMFYAFCKLMTLYSLISCHAPYFQTSGSSCLSQTFLASEFPVKVIMLLKHTANRVKYFYCTHIVLDPRIYCNTWRNGWMNK